MNDNEQNDLVKMKSETGERKVAGLETTWYSKLFARGREYIKNNWLVTLLLLVIVVALPIVKTSGIYISVEGAPEANLILGILLLLAGLLAGWLGGLIGTGGCAILLPVFTFWLGYSAPVAIGTTLFVVIFTALSGGYGHYRQGNMDIGAVAWMAPAGVAGVLIGSWLFTLLADRTDLICFILGIIFLIPTVRMIWEGVSPESREFSHLKIGRNLKGMSVFSMLVGLLSGLVGLGGGYLLVPGLIYIFAVPVYVTMGTSLATVFPLALVGGGIKLVQGYVALDAALLVAAGTIIGAQISAATIKKYKPATLKLIFGLYFLYAACKFIMAYI
ncbi:MAG: sulfite exporter TauE/SafE family protein [Bacillota bacterium]|nr:sulfite exporter TauE/SafE family protein [Bacillota bacterium]